MKDVTTLHDDLVAINRTIQSLPKTASTGTRSELEDLIKDLEGKLGEELRLLPETERHDIMWCLGNEGGGYSFGEMMALM